MRTVTALRFLPHGGNYVVRAFEFDNDPGIVKLDPRWYQASLRFVAKVSSTFWMAPTTCCFCSAW